MSQEWDTLPEPFEFGQLGEPIKKKHLLEAIRKSAADLSSWGGGGQFRLYSTMHPDVARQVEILDAGVRLMETGADLAPAPPPKHRWRG